MYSTRYLARASAEHGGSLVLAARRTGWRASHQIGTWVACRGAAIGGRAADARRHAREERRGRLLRSHAEVGDAPVVEAAVAVKGPKSRPKPLDEDSPGLNHGRPASHGPAGHACALLLIVPFFLLYGSSNGDSGYCEVQVSCVVSWASWDSFSCSRSEDGFQVCMCYFIKV